MLIYYNTHQTTNYFIILLFCDRYCIPDSGTSTLPGDDNGYDIQFQSELDEETTNAMRILDSVVFTEEHQYEDDTDSLQVKPTPRVRKNVPPPVAPRRRTTVAYEKDRSMTEVSDGEAVEENFEKFGVWRQDIFHII